MPRWKYRSRDGGSHWQSLFLLIKERQAEATDNLVLLEDDDPFFKATDNLRDVSLNPAMPVPGSCGRGSRVVSYR